MKFENSNAVCVIDSHHGTFIPQIFAQMYQQYLDKEDFDILNNPEHENYFDVWNEIESTKVFTNEKGERYIFCQIEGDVYEIPENEMAEIEWDEIY